MAKMLKCNSKQLALCKGSIGVHENEGLASFKGLSRVEEGGEEGGSKAANKHQQRSSLNIDLLFSGGRESNSRCRLKNRGGAAHRISIFCYKEGNGSDFI